MVFYLLFRQLQAGVQTIYLQQILMLKLSNMVIFVLIDLYYLLMNYTNQMIGVILLTLKPRMSITTLTLNINILIKSILVILLN